MSRPTALVRRPSPRLAEGLVTHIRREAIDLALAERQWVAYCSAFSNAGWLVTEVPPVDNCPDGVFIEDTVVMAHDLAVLASPGAPSRRAEVHSVEVVLGDLGYQLRRLPIGASLDGGDVLKEGNRWWVGVGGRTNFAAIEALGQVLDPHGIEVIAVPVSRVLHLKSAVTALPDGSIIGFGPLVEDPEIFRGRFRAVSEPEGAHVVILGDNTLLMSAAAPHTAAEFGDDGFHVISVDISEFEKLEGCVTCLSVRLRG